MISRQWLVKLRESRVGYKQCAVGRVSLPNVLGVTGSLIVASDSAGKVSAMIITAMAGEHDVSHLAALWMTAYFE